MESSEGKPVAWNLDDCLSVRDGELFIEGCRARDLAERFGTPLYVMSEDQLRRNARRHQAAFEDRWPGEVLLLPSIKANHSLAVRQILNSEQLGCDVFGPAELEAAIHTGVPPDRISLNGPMKTAPLLERAIAACVRITLDDVSELEETVATARLVGKRSRARLRVRPDLIGFDSPSEMSAAGDSIRDAVQRYKAGIPTEDLLSIDASKIHDPAIDIVGLHLHLGRHSADPGMWVGAVDALTGLLARLLELWPGWTPSEIDLGGGFPVPRDPFGRLLPQRAEAADDSPGPDAFAEVICPHLAEQLIELGIDPSGVRLELEPGRAIYADAGVHLATVGNVKRQTSPMPLAWVETDSSDAYLADVNLEFNRWTCLPVDSADSPPAMTADVTGRTCALDVIVPSASLPEISRGDVLAFLDTGAYQDASASNFNALPRPGTVLVTGAEAELIRRHETIEDVFARDLVPKRLTGDHKEWGLVATAVSGLDHFSVTCSNLDRSIAFYSGLLGIPVRARGASDDSSEFKITGQDPSGIHWADLELRHGQVLELIEYPVQGRETADVNANGPGSTHLALRVADVDATFKRLSQAGVPIRTEPVTIETPGAWQGARAFYASDPDGVTVELIQPGVPSLDR